MTMAMWKRRETKRTKAESERAESELLRQGVIEQALRLDEFVASLRMEVDRTEGVTDDRPDAGH